MSTNIPLKQYPSEPCAAFDYTRCPAKHHCAACHRLYVGYVALCPVHAAAFALLAERDAAFALLLEIVSREMGKGWFVGNGWFERARACLAKAGIPLPSTDPAADELPTRASRIEPM